MVWYWGNGVQWWGWLLMALMMVVFWGFVIWVIVALTRWKASDATLDRSDSGDPERVLARRFAKGDIDEEEYHRRLDALRRHGPKVNGENR